MANNGLPMRINNMGVRELNCDLSVKPVAEGGCSFWFPGKDGMQLDAGLLTETIAAITSECYNRAASQRISGADAIANLGCGFSHPEFTNSFIYGWHESSGLGGDIQSSINKPGQDDCWDCSKTDSETCDPRFAIWADYCLLCDDKVVGREFMVIRNISQATIANRKRVGGQNPDSFNADINLTIDSNDNFGYGPGDLLVSDDADGNPECSAVTCGIDCPADLDLSALDAMCGGCTVEAAGCKVTPELLLEFPELDIPLLTL